MQMIHRKFIFPFGLSLLWLGLFFSYFQTLAFAPLEYDDFSYLNLHPLAGVEMGSARFWNHLFANPTVNLWTPLTDLSHQILFRISEKPPVHHFVNVLLHGANATIWAVLLRRVTKGSILAISVALLFAWHPITVESVAWISGRKDLLCTSFISLSFLAYSDWVTKQKRRYYVATFLMMLAAVLSKPIAFVLPLLFFVFDFWPLERSLKSPFVYLEKLPFLFLSLISVVLTLHFQSEGGQAVYDGRSFMERGAGALWALEHNLASFFWPVRLHLNYTNPTELPLRWLLVAGGIASAVFAFAVWKSKRAPWLLVGIVWYLLTIGPTLGFVHAGNHLSADRYSYLPCIGLLIALAGFFQKAPQKLLGLTVAIAVPLIVLNISQVRTWESLETLSKRTLDFQPDNPSAHYHLALIAKQKGEQDAALVHLEEALSVEPTHSEANLLLAQIYEGKGNYRLAYQHFSVAARLRTREPWIQERLAVSAYRKGDLDKTREHILAAFALARPGDESLGFEDKWKLIFPNEPFPQYFQLPR